MNTVPWASNLCFIIDRADKSSRGMKQSFGIMVNYKYDLDLVHERTEEYVLRHQISASQAIHKILNLSKTSVN